MLFLFFLLQFANAENWGCDKTWPSPGISQFLEKYNCIPLPVGKEKVVNLEYFESPTMVEHKYALERTTSNIYTVKLNVIFRENTIPAKENTPVTRQMRDKVKNCLKEINLHLKSSDHQSIHLRLLEPTSENQKKYNSIATYIDVDSEPIERENSHHYSLKSPCSTIAHELLHLLGLTDEYEEIKDIQSWEQQCRSYGPDDSIMSHHVFATGEIPEIKSYTYIDYCYCESDDNCAPFEDDKKNQMKDCPSGYKRQNMFVASSNQHNFSSKQDYEFYFNPSAIGGMSGMTLGGPKEVIILNTLPSGRPANSYLYPAHFRAITAPLCYEQNSVYYSCTRDSYFRPYKLIGSCHKRPSVCNKPLEWLK